MQPLQIQLDQSQREICIGQAQNQIQQIQTTKYEDEQIYKKVCKSKLGSVPECKFKAINGSISVSSTILKCFQAWIKFRANVDQSSPKKLTETTLYHSFQHKFSNCIKPRFRCYWIRKCRKRQS
ncbi:START_domain-containing protein [Hexamita inflata]|uniref:START domain-containing protein n=1 Tax=Hexamita inflata TaxID=28002 RepID=A0AA86VQG3_9EUKA|nr:START domain-containing protein [Hexamita inflata]